eukprot:755334-Hanusia_phi.AAC.3
MEMIEIGMTNELGCQRSSLSDGSPEAAGEDGRRGEKTGGAERREPRQGDRVPARVHEDTARAAPGLQAEARGGQEKAPRHPRSVVFLTAFFFRRFIDLFQASKQDAGGQQRLKAPRSTPSSRSTSGPVHVRGEEQQQARARPPAGSLAGSQEEEQEEDDGAARVLDLRLEEERGGKEEVRAAKALQGARGADLVSQLGESVEWLEPSPVLSGVSSHLLACAVCRTT